MNIISVIGGSLCQWDIGRKVQVRTDCNEVHIGCVKDTEALVVIPYEENGQLVADIPNIVLQTGRNIAVYCVKDNVTVCSKVFGVKDRERPSDYLYVETPVLSWTEIMERLDGLSETDAETAAHLKALDEADAETNNRLNETESTTNERLTKLETAGLDVVLPETHLIVERKNANGGIAYLYERMGLTEGKTYTVFWDGKPYECVATHGSTGQGSDYTELVVLGGVNEPFVIFEWPKGKTVIDVEGATAWVGVDAGVEEVDIRITAKGIVTVDCIFIRSSESNKKFKLTIDDSGNLSTEEV